TRVVVAVTALATASVLGWWLGAHHDDAAPLARVVEVLDGDTVVVRFAGGSTDTIRLVGVNTPKTG
ncbi:MAG TPA: endonuclease, partial [Acidimicrobiia bacterium]